MSEYGQLGAKSGVSHLLHFLALYDWAEPFSFAKHPDLVCRLVDDAGIHPTKVTAAEIDRARPRRRTISARLNLLDATAVFTKYAWIAFDEPIDGDFTNVRSQLAIISEGRQYRISKTRSAFTLSDVLRHLKLICDIITPRYGFMYSLQGMEALMFPGGTAVTGMDRTISRRVHDLGHTLRLSKEHLAGKLHDVYGLNVLSPLHLERRVEGAPLVDWIGGGRRGELIAIKPAVHAWIVPDDIRPGVRVTLFREGALIASV